MNPWQVVRAGLAELVLNEARNFLIALIAASVVGLLSLALVIWHERTLPSAVVYRLERAWERCESAWSTFELAIAEHKWAKAAGRLFRVFWLNYLYYKLLTFVGRIDTLIVAAIVSISAAVLGNDFWDFALKIWEAAER